MTVFIAFISIFAVVKLFPLSLELLKPPATYAIFAFIRLFFKDWLAIPKLKPLSLFILLLILEKAFDNVKIEK